MALLPLLGETDPITYANPREVTLVRLERGIDIALFGSVPERRLPIESFFGFVIAKNRVPIGYGAVACVRSWRLRCSTSCTRFHPGTTSPRW